MARVLLTIGQVGVAIELEERLGRHGHAVSSGSVASAEDASVAVDAVIMDGDDNVTERICRWQRSRSFPALVVIGKPAEAKLAGDLGAVALTSTEGLLDAIERAIAGRFDHVLSVTAARAALDVEPSLDGPERVAAIVRAGRVAPEAIVKRALSRFRRHYLACTALVEELREQRVLDVPEVELARSATGAATLERVVAASSLGPIDTGRRIWTLASVGALRLDREPFDLETPARRRLALTRNHIRARRERPLPTAYDVLDITRGAYVEDVEEAITALAFRYSPEPLSSLELTDLGSDAAAIWERILEARAALYYESGQRQLDAFIDHQLRVEPARVARSWGNPVIDAKGASELFARGQASLTCSEVFAALSDFAAAARAHPDHPTYEAYLAWTRYRCEVARGADRALTARRERSHAESHCLGRRPFAQALVALALLCLADGDKPAAHWHLTECLALNPELPAARLILARL